MPPKSRSAEYFDGWYADKAATAAVGEIMNRHVGFPPGTRAGVVPAEAIPELTAGLRLSPGSTLLDLACGRGAYGLLIAKRAGTVLVGVDFSAQALAGAREQAAHMGVCNASFRGRRARGDGSARCQRRRSAVHRRHSVRRRALWQEAVALDPGDDPALRSLHDEGVKSLEWGGLLRRVLAFATAPR